MTKVVLGMSTSLDGIAGPRTADEDGMAVFGAVLGWVFPLRSWREQQGEEGGEDSVDSQVWAGEFARFGPQIVGRTMFDYGIEAWGENPPFHAPVFVVTHRGPERIDKSGGTSYTFVTDGVAAVVDEVVLHITPVLLGRGVRLFGTGQAELRCIETIQARVRFTSDTRSDDRGCPAGPGSVVPRKV